MTVKILDRPTTFDRVDRVKWAAGQEVRRHDEDFWILGGPLTFSVDGRVFQIPKGFTTDGASIPAVGQLLTGWARWDPPQRWAAIIHDWLYCAEVSKDYADHAFRAALLAEGADWWMRTAMYRAVRWFGHGAYTVDQAAGPLIYAGKS